MAEETLSDVLARAKGRKVLCIGDLMLDRFVYGDVSRVSPEAPVAVLKQARQSEMPGGAANVARNLAAMDLEAALFGIAGDDDEGRALRDAISASPGISDHVSVTAARKTTLKTRFVAGGQQLLRVDAEIDAPVGTDETEAILSAVRSEITDAAAIVVSDYGKGLVTAALCAGLGELAREHDLPFLIDPKRPDAAQYRGGRLIKPNLKELRELTGLPAETDAEIDAAMRALLVASGAEAVVVTRAAQGMSWLTASGETGHRRGDAREVFDVSGAGDTSIAALTVGAVAGATLGASVQLAIAASGLAVAKSGTATVSAGEIADHMRGSSGRSPRDFTLEACRNIVEAWRDRGLSVGFTNGCFDLLHPGHLKVIEEARARCDRLVVAVNSDASVKRLKGESRPVAGEQDRAIMLSGLKPVDAVVIFEEDTPLETIEALAPDLIVKGGDYQPGEIVGADFVKARGGAVHVVELVEGRSSSNLIAKSTGR